MEKLFISGSTQKVMAHLTDHRDSSYIVEFSVKLKINNKQIVHVDEVIFCWKQFYNFVHLKSKMLSLSISLPSKFNNDSKHKCSFCFLASKKWKGIQVFFLLFFLCSNCSYRANTNLQSATTATTLSSCTVWWNWSNILCKKNKVFTLYSKHYF